MANDAKRILFVSGGSGGHVFPCIDVLEATARAAEERDINVEVHYASGEKELASSAVTASPCTFTKHAVRSGKLNRFITVKHIGQTRDFFLGLSDAFGVVRTVRPDLVFSKGGAVSVPIAWMARLFSIPVYCHETDARLGLSNRMVSRLAELVFTAYPVENYPQLPAEKRRYVGQPVRRQFFAPDNTKVVMVDDKEVKNDRPLVVVTGGSQGARAINTLVSGAWDRLLDTVRLVHHTGSTDYAHMTALASQLSAEKRQYLHLAAFITDGVPELFARSAVVISRSGGTVAELAAVGAPTVLIPLTGSGQDHQWVNARIFEAAHAAVVLDELVATPADLTATVDEVLRSSEKRGALSTAIRGFARKEAAHDIAGAILDRVIR